MPFWVLLFLLMATASWAATPNPLRICTLGDIQKITDCKNATTAWDHGEAAVQGIVDNPSQCHVVLFPGDVVLGHGTDSCWCASRVPVGTCAEEVNPITGNNCDDVTLPCNDDEAKICDGGTPGGYCEYERVKTLVDMLKAANIPVIVSAGNHDLDKEGIYPDETHEFTIFNSYFGAGKLSADFDESGVFEHQTACATCADGFTEQPDSSWHVLTAGGTQWLFINVGWTMLPWETTGYVGMTEPTRDWIRTVIDGHLGMPTIFVTHCGVGQICFGTGMPAGWATQYENAWCGDSLLWWRWCTVGAIYDEFLLDPIRAPQILAVIGGHIRDNAYHITQNTLYPTVGITFDSNTEAIPELQAECPWNQPENAGGAILSLIRIDPQANVISTTAYSYEQQAWCDVRGAQPATHYQLDLPMCANNTRFNFPAATCPEREPSPECCRK